MIIKNGLVHSLDKGFYPDTIYIEETRFSDSTMDQNILDASNCYVIPGLIDIHFHGGDGADFSDGSLESLQKLGRYELLHGITSICPASMTLPEDQLLNICKTAAEYARRPRFLTASPTSSSFSSSCAELVGIHLEGPFISPAKKGAQKESNIVPPSAALFEKLWEASDGLLKIITMAPETDSALSFIREFSDRVHISVGHTAADYDTASRAFDAGADHLTHLFNAMSPLHHRNPGPIGAAFEHPEVFVEMICDGVHIHPAVMKASLQMFGKERIVFISDSMRATGLPDGHYELGGQPVDVKGNLATLPDGTIAASVTNLMDCMKKTVSVGIPLETVVRCASYNPACSIGVSDRLGSIEVGKQADCVLLNIDTFEIQAIIKAGQIAFSASHLK